VSSFSKAQSNTSWYLTCSSNFTFTPLRKKLDLQAKLLEIFKLRKPIEQVSGVGGFWMESDS